MNLREALFQSRNKIKEVLERQVGMQSADDVELGDCFGVAGSGGLERLFEGHGVGAGSVLLAAESAQAAGSDANVGRINVPVDVEIGFVAMQALADVVREPTDSKYVASLVKQESVFRGEAFAREHLVVNSYEAPVISLKGVSHCFDDTSG